MLCQCSVPWIGVFVIDCVRVSLARASQVRSICSTSVTSQASTLPKKHIQWSLWAGWGHVLDHKCWYLLPSTRHLLIPSAAVGTDHVSTMLYDWACVYLHWRASKIPVAAEMLKTSTRLELRSSVAKAQTPLADNCVSFGFETLRSFCQAHIMLVRSTSEKKLCVRNIWPRSLLSGSALGRMGLCGNPLTRAHKLVAKKTAQPSILD